MEHFPLVATLFIPTTEEAWPFTSVAGEDLFHSKCSFIMEKPVGNEQEMIGDDIH